MINISLNLEFKYFVRLRNSAPHHGQTGCLNKLTTNLLQGSDKSISD